MRIAIREADGIPPLVALLRREEAAVVVEIVAGALRNLACHGTHSNYTAVRGAGGMAVHSRHPWTLLEIAPSRFACTS